MKGHAGKVLRVDLFRRSARAEAPGEAFYRKYLGGSALGLYYLLRECPAGADPFGPENVLVFAAGSTAGAPFAGNSRLSVTAKSPLTGLAGDAEVGGYVPAELKAAGWDAIVVTGKADRPVYLSIRDDKVEIRDAGVAGSGRGGDGPGLWGLGTVDTEEALRRELGDPKVKVLSIGPAGEKLARIACVMHHGSRAAGRNGLGAVMGSKNLKAVSVRGTGRPEFADPAALKALGALGAERAAGSQVLADLARHGTAGDLASINAAGALPTPELRRGLLRRG